MRKKRETKAAQRRNVPSRNELMGVPYDVKKLAQELKVSTVEAGDLLKRGRSHRKEDTNQ